MAQIACAGIILPAVPYTSVEAREQLLDDFAAAIEDIAVALACIAAAYERLDERAQEQLEERLFRPVQLGYGRAKRTHASFAERYGLPGRAFAPASPGAPSQDAQTLIERAVEATREADEKIGALQDSMLPVEVGDTELRAGLAEVRGLIDDLPARARALVRIVGR